MGISVSRVNPEHIYAVIESDSKAEKGGCFASTDGGKTWTRVSKDHSLVQRAWYYTEIFADPQNENTVYVLNTSILKSIDGGKTWSRLSGTHGDHHGLWITRRTIKILPMPMTAAVRLLSTVAQRGLCKAINRQPNFIASMPTIVFLTAFMEDNKTIHL